MPSFTCGLKRSQIDGNDARRLHVESTPRLIGIVERIALDNTQAAETFATELERHCSLLATTPEMGRRRPEVGPEVRSLVQRDYLIFYRYSRTRDRVSILAVWHGRRRLPRLGG